jgi:hypothetical protein
MTNAAIVSKVIVAMWFEVIVVNKHWHFSYCCNSVPTTPGHAVCLVARENVTDMDGSMRCSSLSLEREEHLQMKHILCPIHFHP